MGSIKIPQSITFKGISGPIGPWLCEKCNKLDRDGFIGPAILIIDGKKLELCTDCCTQIYGINTNAKVCSHCRLVMLSVSMNDYLDDGTLLCQDCMKKQIDKLLTRSEKETFDWKERITKSFWKDVELFEKQKKDSSDV
jgi:hypothetical protein